jgi:hypothetical protein
MPDIEFKDLNQSIGTELFSDAESFLEDLTDDAANIVGGSGQDAAIMTTIASGTSIATTIVRPVDYPTKVTTTLYNPNPGGNSGINCTGFYTTVYKPHQPRHPRPIHYTFVTNDI